MKELINFFRVNKRKLIDRSFYAMVAFIFVGAIGQALFHHPFFSVLTRVGFLPIVVIMLLILGFCFVRFYWTCILTIVSPKSIEKDSMSSNDMGRVGSVIWLCVLTVFFMTAIPSLAVKAVHYFDPNWHGTTFGIVDSNAKPFSPVWIYSQFILWIFGERTLVNTIVSLIILLVIAAFGWLISFILSASNRKKI